MVALGKASYGETKKRVFFKINEGSNKFRIMPPIGDLAEKGTWAVYERIHWGLKTSDGRRLNFKCVERRDQRTKMVTQRCAMCDVIAERRKERDDKMAQYQKQGLDKDQVTAKLKPWNDWLQTYNVQSQWNINAMDTNGEVGKLTYAHTYHKKIQLLIGKLTNPEKGKKRVDPIAPEEGVIFDFFYKRGNQKTRVQDVSLVEEQVELPNGDTANVLKRFPLSEKHIEKYLDMYHDLTKLARALTPEQVERVVKADFDPTVVDALYSNGKVTEKVSEVTDPETEDEPEETSASLPETKPLLTKPLLETKAPTAAPPKVATVSSDIEDEEAFFRQFNQKNA